MAMLRATGLRSGLQMGCRHNVGRVSVGGRGLPPMRRAGTPGLFSKGQNQLLPAPVSPIGYGQTMLGPATQTLRKKTVMHSFLGVGAPEALLVAIVALVVFGPKGLADAAKSLGQTLRAFQPTIREVVEVSQEIKGTLEQELGLDEIRQATSLRPTPRPILRTDTSSDTASMSSSSSDGVELQPVNEEQAKQVDPDIELKRAMSEQAAWGGQLPVAAARASAETAVQPKAAATCNGSSSSVQDLSKLSLAELEAELARRKSTP